MKGNHKYRFEENLAIKDTETLHEVDRLIEGIEAREDKAGLYLRRQVVEILDELGKMRDAVLYCNDFLLQLQDHIESRLGTKDPDTVLDCNRFVRGFLVENLALL